MVGCKQGVSGLSWGYGRMSGCMSRSKRGVGRLSVGGATISDRRAIGGGVLEGAGSRMRW